MTHSPLMSLPAQALLEMFGAGGHKPGSGSAAALVGLLAGSLIRTVAILTSKKEAYRAVYPQIAFIKKEIDERFNPSLSGAFERDAEAFAKVVAARRRRDNERTNTRRRRELNDLARESLIEATEIPLAICADCLRLAEHGLSMYDIGFKSARGDSGTAVSTALAGCFSALFTVYINLSSFRSGEWARTIRVQADELFRAAQQLQASLFSRVVSLQGPIIDESQLSFGFARPDAG